MLSVKNAVNHHKERNLKVMDNSSQAQQIIRNCVAYCAWSEALEGTLLQKQANSVIEGRGG